jgi:hypothetical protein
LHDRIAVQQAKLRENAIKVLLKIFIAAMEVIMGEMKIPAAPLFRDPIHDGAADPVIIWNREEKAWWILYTNRRADAPDVGYSWIHGTDIGIASSTDGGRNWLYRGTMPGLEFENGRNTYWAPEVIWHDGLYHMYMSYVRGIPTNWEWGREKAAPQGFSYHP